MCVLSHSSYILIQVFEFELRSELNSLERHMHTKVWLPSESSLGAWRLEMSLVITVVFWWVASCRFSQASVFFPFPQTPQLYLLALEALVAGCNKTNKMLAVWKYCLCVCVKVKGRTSGGLHHKGIIKQTTFNQPDLHWSVSLLIRQAERREARCPKTNWTDLVSF